MDSITLLYIFAYSALIIGSALIKVIMKLLGKYEETPITIQKEELISVPFNLIGLAGMFGYFYDVVIFNQIFWQIYVILMLLYTVVGYKLPKMKLIREKSSTKFFLMLNALALLIGGPMFYMVIVYAWYFPGLASA